MSVKIVFLSFYFHFHLFYICLLVKLIFAIFYFKFLLYFFFPLKSIVLYLSVCLVVNFFYLFIFISIHTATVYFSFYLCLSVCLSVKIVFSVFLFQCHKYFICLLKFSFIFVCLWFCLFMQLLHMSCIMSHSWANYTMCLLCTSFGWGNCLLPKTILFFTLIKIYLGKLIWVTKS